MLRELLFEIGSRFLDEKQKSLKDNVFADYVRNNGKNILRDVLGDDNLIVKGSVGAGNWAEIAWLGIFNVESTTSATSGIYIVYLFSADLKHVYLAQGQGVTQVKNEFGKGQVEELLRRSAIIRARVPEYAQRFIEGPIELGGSTSLAKEYDSAVAYFVRYETNNLPSEDTLLDDLHEMQRLYGLLLARGGVDNLETYATFGEISVAEDASLTEKRQYIRHARIERNAKAASAAKKARGYTCEGCGINFEWIYGERGKGFIEAHHLVPLHTLPEGVSVKIDAQNDFAVVCSNCHRIIHRSKPMLSIKELRDLTGVRMLRRAFKQKYGD